jgi:hypothetical protein
MFGLILTNQTRDFAQDCTTLLIIEKTKEETAFIIRVAANILQSVSCVENQERLTNTRAARTAKKG